MELLNQMDGFDVLGKVKMVMATNRPDVLDPALLRPGRLDRKIEIPLPNEAGNSHSSFLKLFTKLIFAYAGRLDIIKIHASKITKHGDIDFEAVAKLAEGFNGADLRNICTEAGMPLKLWCPAHANYFLLGMFAIRAERDYCIEEDFMKAVRKVADSKKLESMCPSLFIHHQHTLIFYKKLNSTTKSCNICCSIINNKHSPVCLCLFAQCRCSCC